MIFEKNAKIGELAFSKSFLFMVSVAVFDDLERVMMSSEVFLKWQRRIFTTVFNRSFNCLPDGQKKFQFIFIRNFLKKIYFFLIT
jgi:hypothetical protein